MIYRQLGTSDLHISRIGFGCMSLKPGHQDNEKILLQAVESGINYFDTADLYDRGANEELIGRVLKSKRDEVVIATKVGNQWKEDGTGWRWNPSKDYILRSVDESLRRLQTDHIDLYQLHGGTIDDPMDETIDAFEQLVKAGKIRYYGISSIRPNVIRYWIEHSNIISVMMQYSLLDRRPEEECLPLLHEKNIGVLARGSVAQGLLIDKPAKPYLDHSEQEVDAAAKTVQSISTNDRTTSQTAVQFVWSHPAITSAVVGIRTIKQLEDAIQVFSSPALSDGALKSLQKVAPARQYKDHR